MSTTLTVSSTETATAVLRLGSSSLPAAFKHVDGVGDVFGLLGKGNWVAAAIEALRTGALGIIVLDPSPRDLAPLMSVLKGLPRPIVLDRGWASSPSVQQSSPEFVPLSVPTALVECRVNGPTGACITGTLLSQLALVTAAVGPVQDLKLVRRDVTGYDVLGTMGTGADLVLAAVFSDVLPQTGSVRIVRSETSVLLELGPIDVATPGKVTVTTEDGKNQLPTLWETPHRGAWRRLHESVMSGAFPYDELTQFAHDVTLVTALLNDNQG